MLDDTEFTVKEEKSSALRAFVWTLLIVALPLGLGFLVARGDLDPSPVLSALRNTVKAEEASPQTSSADAAATSSAASEAASEPASQPASQPASKGEQLDTLLEHISDLETRITLDAALRDEPRLDGLDLRVEVSGGAVVLNGSAVTPEQKETAELIAAALVGEDRLTSRLRVSGEAAGAHNELARRIEFELFSTEAFDLTAIDVSSEGGVVTLRGAVRDRAEQLLAERLAQDVAGVSQVVNELHLASPENTASTAGPSAGENDAAGEVRQGT